MGTRPSAPPPPITPATRPLTQPVTETFALRDEVEEWIGSPSIPPPADSIESAHSADARREASAVRGSWRFFAAAAVVVAVALAGTLAVRNAGSGASDHGPGRIAAPAHTAVAAAPVVAPANTSRQPELAAGPAADAGVAHAPPARTTTVSGADDPAKASATISVTSDCPRG